MYGWVDDSGIHRVFHKATGKPFGSVRHVVHGIRLPALPENAPPVEIATFGLALCRRFLSPVSSKVDTSFAILVGFLNDNFPVDEMRAVSDAAGLECTQKE